MERVYDNSGATESVQQCYIEHHGRTGARRTNPPTTSTGSSADHSAPLVATSSFRQHVPPPPHNQRTLSYQWHCNQCPNWGINSVWFNTLLKRLLADFLSQPLCMICKWPKSNAWYATRINQWPTNCIVSTICINWLFCIHLYTELCHFLSTNYDHHSQWTLVATC